MKRLPFETQEEFEDRNHYNEIQSMIHENNQSEPCCVCKGLHKTDKDNQIVAYSVDGKPPRFVHESCLAVVRFVTTGEL